MLAADGGLVSRQIVDIRPQAAQAGVAGEADVFYVFARDVSARDEIVVRDDDYVDISADPFRIVDPPQEIRRRRERTDVGAGLRMD
jgi:hypothetical protein